MRLHLVSLPHTQTTREWSLCPFTQKVRRFADMMTAKGHEVILYSGEENEAACAEHVVIYPDSWQKPIFGSWDWDRVPFNAWGTGYPVWNEANAMAAEAISKRAQPQDFLCIIAGKASEPLGDLLPDLIPVEWGIGYPDVWAPYRVYESHAWRSFLNGAREVDHTVHNYDTVIPNSFAPDEFPQGRGDGGYYLFMGRMVNLKGPRLAAMVTERIGAKLILAGQGVEKVEPGKITCDDGTVIVGDVEYVGTVKGNERASLLGGAIATLVMSQYFEPFGGVAGESMMCGTPVLSTDWGAFPETVIDGVSGWRCHTLAEFADRARDCAAMTPWQRRGVRTHALAHFSTDVTSIQYDTYFRRLDVLKTQGWRA